MKIGKYTLSGVSIALLILQLPDHLVDRREILVPALALPARVDARRGHRSRNAHAWPLPKPAAYSRWLRKHAAVR